MKYKNRIALCTAFIAGVTSFMGGALVSAQADRVQTTQPVVEGEPKTQVYYGDMVTPTSNLDDYTDKEFSIKDCNLENPLIEFVINSSSVGDEQNYTPDFERLYIDIVSETDSSKAMSISIYEHYLVTRDAERSIAINANGVAQSLGATYRGYKVENKNKLATGYGGNIVQSFDGYSHLGGYIDENGVAIQKGDNRAIRLFYDKVENALYTDVGYSLKRDGKDLISGYKLIGPEGNQKIRWLIRDFDSTDYIDQYGAPITQTWAGFEDNDKLKFSLRFDKIVDGKSPAIIISKYAGKTVLESPIIVDTPAYGQSNLAYPIPEPVFYDIDNYSEKTFSEMGGEYKVGKRGETKNEYKSFTTGEIFTPTTSGIYTITYKIPSLNIENSIDITVKDDLENVSLTPNPLPDSCSIHTDFDIGVVCDYANVQKDKAKTYLELFKDGVPYPNSNNKIEIEKSYPYTFQENGLYTLVYTSKDYLGRETRTQKTIDVRRYYVDFAQGIQSNMAVAVGEEVKKPSVADIELFDISFNQIVDIQACKISIKYNNGEFEPYINQSLHSRGEYEIKYEIVYDAYGPIALEIIRKIFVYDTTYSIIQENGIPQGTKLLQEIDNPVQVRLKAVKGQKITIPYNYFNTQLDIVTFTDTTSTQDITDIVAKGAFSFEPTKSGIYQIFALNENDYYRVTKDLQIDVRDKWIDFENVDDLTLPIGANIYDYAPTCKDFYGNLVTNYSTSIQYLGETVENDTGVLDKFGMYEVVYSYAVGDEKVEAKRKVITTDSEAPIFALREQKTTGYKKTTIALAGYEIKDDSNINPKVVISVTHNGKEVNIYNNSFYAENEGEYVVTYYAIDTQGHAVTAQYVVTVKGYTGIIVGGVLSTIALALATTILIIVLKKNKKQKGEN